MDWQPIETAPNGERIIIAYDDGGLNLIQAKDNDFTWRPYRGKRIIGLITPTHWTYPQDPPQCK